MASSSSIDIDMMGCFAEGTAPYVSRWCGGGTKRLCSSRRLVRGCCGRREDVCDAGARGLGACRQRCKKTMVGHVGGGAKVRAPRMRKVDGSVGAWQDESNARRVWLAACRLKALRQVGVGRRVTFVVEETRWSCRSENS